MHSSRQILVALLCLALGPAVAQEGGGDGSGIEVSPDKPKEEGGEKKGDGGYDPEETKKKNVGLAGGGDEGEGGDADAPKVKADLQTRINQAIEHAQVVPGMTRDEVLMSIGYPPAHRTPSLESPAWTYWQNAVDTFVVSFDGNKVSQVQR